MKEQIKEALREVLAWWPLWVFIIVWLSPFVGARSSELDAPMKTKPIFLVQRSHGSYEDYRTDIVSAHCDGEGAEARLRAVQAIHAEALDKIRALDEKYSERDNVDVLWQKWYEALLRIEKRYERKEGVATFESDATFGVICVPLLP